MKTIITATLALCCTFATSLSFAQETSKTQMFGAYPETITINQEILKAAFDYKEGKYISLSFANGFVFSGKVISNVQKYSNLQSMLIESNLYENAVFQISKYVDENKASNYIGRILSVKNDRTDGYKITQDGKGNYYLTKFDASNILQDCSQL